jgi:hypothetical protein
MDMEAMAVSDMPGLQFMGTLHCCRLSVDREAAEHSHATVMLGRRERAVVRCLSLLLVLWQLMADFPRMEGNLGQITQGMVLCRIQELVAGAVSGWLPIP